MGKCRRFFISFIIVAIIGLAAVAGVVMVVDPFFQYHKPIEGYPYVVDDQVDMNPGLARNMDYDSILLGSSMTVNFHKDWFMEELGRDTQKLTYNGAYPRDQKNIMDIAFAAKGKDIKQVFIGIDEMNYSAGVDETKFPITDYLYDYNKLNDVQYIFNKDVLLDYCIKPLIDRKDATDWNKIYPFWWQDEHYSKALVLMYYEEANEVELEANEHMFDEAIENNLNYNIIPYIEAYPDTKFTVFYPPYSILYWNDVCNRNELKATLQKYRVITNKLLEYDNVEIYFFTGEEEIICNLNNYADYTHYHDDICHYMVKCFADGTDRVTSDNIEEKLENLYKLASEYDYDSIWDDWYN